MTTSRRELLKWALPSTLLTLLFSGKAMADSGAGTETARLPGVVPPGSTADSTGGQGPGKEIRADEASLRSEVGANDGFTFTGRCQTIAELRNVEPGVNNQLISVVCHSVVDRSRPYYVQSGGEFQYDSSDVSTADDNWLCIVTPEGKRWKRVINDTLLNLAWAGVKPGDNITAALMQAIAYLKKLYISGNAPASTPVIAVNAGRYSITESIVKPPFIKMVMLGSVEIDASSMTTGVVFDIFNDNTIPAPSFTGPGQNNEDISCVGGSLTLTGSGRISGGATAFAYGNKSSGLAPCRGVGFRNVIAKQFGIGLSLRTNDTYLLTFSDSRLELNDTNFSVSSPSNTNSGEAIVLSNITFGNAGKDHVYINAPEMELVFDKCKADYAHGDVINIGTQCNYSSLKFSNFRCEEFGGYLLSGASSALGNISVFFTNLTVLGRVNKNKIKGNSPSRKLFNNGKGIAVNVNGFETFVEMRPYTESINISEEAGGSLTVSGYLPRSFRYLTGKRYILNRGHDFSEEVVGAEIATISSPLTRFTVTGLSGVTGTVIALDGGKAIELKGTGPSDYIELQTEYIPVQAGDNVNLSGAVQALSSTGTINFTAQMLWLDKDLVAVDNSTTSNYGFASAYNDATLPNYAEGGARKLSSSAFTKTAPPGTVYAKAKFVISGFSGVIQAINLIAFKSL